MGFEVDTKSTKYACNEEVFSYQIYTETPWSLKLQRAYRVNQFSTANSLKFLREEVQPTCKQSITVEHSVSDGVSQVRNFTGEVAFAVKPEDPAFIKFEIKL